MDGDGCRGCIERDRRIADLQAQVATLAARVAALTRLVEEAQRAAKRQAAPFRTGEPKPDPKPPGRKAGEAHGRHAHRPPPAADQVTEVIDVPLLPVCPDCGGGVAETGVEAQFQTELPATPIVRRFDIHVGTCGRCHRRVRGRHPLQTSAATGAAASQLGPQAQALVVHLAKDAGLSYGKVAAVLGQLRIPLTRGAAARVVLRAADRLAPDYAAICRRLSDQEHLTPDETGWRVGGHPAWLHAWVGADITGFAIDPSRGAEVLAGVIGWDWPGVMTHDGCPSYDRFGEAVHQQCVGHVLRRAHDLEEIQVGPAKAFPRQVIDLFQDALAVRDEARAGRAGAAAVTAAHARAVDAVLAVTDRPRTNAANERLAAHLRDHAEQWFMFLIDPSIPATNNAAERALRGPIVNRKVWGGNRTARGATAQSVLQSVLATCKQRATSFVTVVVDALCGRPTTLFNAPPASPA